MMKIIRKTKRFLLQAAVARHTAVKVVIVCTITMLGVSTVFMTQSIFVEIAESFRINLARAYLAFSVASLFYAAAFCQSESYGWVTSKQCVLFNHQESIDSHDRKVPIGALFSGKEIMVPVMPWRKA